VALAAVAALAAPAQGARYFGVAELREGPGRQGSISGFGKEVAINEPTAGGDLFDARYAGPGTTDRRGIFGRLGRFGSVSLKFEPEGKPKRIRRPRVCTGGPRFWVRWDGTFTGSVRFAPDAGLRGFTRTGSFRGGLQTVPHWHCRGLEPPPPRFDPEAGGIDAFASNCDGRSFDANVEVKPATPPSPDEAPTPADFSASWTKSVGIARVTYSISVEGGPETAVFTDDLGEGTIRPPPPFHGEARIVKEGDSWAWTGSLSARFPGRTVRLAGPAFKPIVTTYKPRPYTSFEFSHLVSC
jgi:hypothetical protein